MKLLLLQDVKGVGQKGTLVDVSEGYGRNFLLPSGLAAVATQKLVSELAHKADVEQKKNESLRKISETLAKKLSTKSLVITTHGGTAGKLYAGLKESEILSTIQKVDSRFPKAASLINYHPIKHSGEHEITVNLPGGVKATVKIIIKSDAEQEKNK